LIQLQSVKSKKLHENGEDIGVSPLIMSKSSFHNALAHQHDFYLSGEVKEPEEYVDWFHIIRNAKDSDIVVIHINSIGGYASTAIQFLRVLEETSARVVVSVEGDCMSAATMIFLSGDIYQISEHSSFMFHSHSSMVAGKSSEIHDNVTFSKTWGDKLIRDLYQDFLTETEILAIINGKDIWMDAETVGKRLDSRNKALEKKAKEEKKKVTTKSKESLTHLTQEPAKENQ